MNLTNICHLKEKTVQLERIVGSCKTKMSSALHSNVKLQIREHADLQPTFHHPSLKRQMTHRDLQTVFKCIETRMTIPTWAAATLKSNLTDEFLYLLDKMRKLMNNFVGLKLTKKQDFCCGTFFNFMACKVEDLSDAVNGL